MKPLSDDEFHRLHKEQAMLLRRLAGANLHTDPVERARVQARIKEIQARQPHALAKRTAAFDVIA